MITTQNPEAILNTAPHYTDERFREPQTLYGRTEEGLSYHYSDRLWKENYLQAKRATGIADATGAKPKTAKWYQSFLSAYFGHKVDVKHILSGWNWSTGYPYVVFGYKEVGK